MSFVKDIWFIYFFKELSDNVMSFSEIIRLCVWIVENVPRLGDQQKDRKILQSLNWCLFIL